MTSPVDTSVKFFSSTMAGAPVLNGVAGAMVAVLDACLKDGFDTKTLSSLTVAGGVATAAYTGTHSALTNAVVLIAGVTGGPTGWAGMNGEQKITNKPTAASVTFATTLPDGTYTGTITMKMAPLGWLKPFSGTNKGAYKSNDVAAYGMLLRVDDASVNFARVVGYEQMSDIDTGVGPFPTTAQISGGGYWAKSVAGTSVASSWTLIGDGRTFYFSVQPGTPANFVGTCRGFGDFLPLRPGGDAYACGLNYSSTATTNSQSDGDLANGSSSQIAMPRAFSGIGSSNLHYSMPYIGTTGSSGITNVLGTFPNPVDGSLYLSARYVSPSGQTYPRADLPGLYHVPQDGLYAVIKPLDQVPGSGALAGRMLLNVPSGAAAFNTVPVVANMSSLMFDITGPWR